MLATVSLMILSLVLGATGTFAVVHQDLAPQRELFLQKAAILLERAQVRLEQCQTDLAEMQSLVQRGLAGESVAAKARLKAERAESDLHCRELDLKETRITGRAPVDDLSGPLIGGEDFIAQRLKAQYESVELELERVQAEFRRIEALAGQGAVSELELSEARADVEEADQAQIRLQQRINLRRAFIDGEMGAEEVELRAMLRDAEGEYFVAEARFEAAQISLQRFTALHERGLVTAGELREAQASVRETDSDLALATVQLKMIRQRLEAFEPGP